jgi:CheY-like chemotaxis protein
MKRIFLHESLEGPLGAALKQVLTTLLSPESFSMTQNLGEADVVLLTSNQALERVYSHDKVFILVGMNREYRAPAETPANVHITSIPTALVDILKALPWDEVTKAAAEPSAPADAPRVLVIDDTEKHCVAARTQLAAQYRLTVVSTYAQGKEEVGQGYDVVLTDLMLPASTETLGTDAITKYVGQEMPLGFVLALLAAKAGVKRIGVVTDLNHHAHPISAALDHLTGIFTVEGAKVVFSNRAGGTEGKDWKGVLDSLLQS